MSEATCLADLLAEESLRPKKQHPGYHENSMTCPRCNGGSSRDKSLTLTIHNDGRGFVAKCWRGKCGWEKFSRLVPLEGELKKPARKQPVAPPAHPPAAQRRTDALYAWWDARGISADTVDAFGIYLSPHWFPHGDREAMVFPYLIDGRVVNRKYRPPEKTPQIQEKDALPSLYNIDAVTAFDVVCVVEGEPDVLAMHEAGYPQTVTLANGAPAELREEDDPRRENDRRFDALSTHQRLLDRVEKFILAGDMDVPGAVLREELARRLGRHRCWLVTWPEGCKDAGDVLRDHGKEAVRAAVENAQPYPIEGIQTIDDDTLVELRHSTPPPVMTTGTIATDKMLKIPADGRLIVVTGYPSSGKSTWMRFISIHLMTEFNRKFLVFSPEMQPWKHFVSLMAETLMRKPFWGRGKAAGMTDAEVRAAQDWLKPRLFMLSADSADKPPSLDWLLERAAIAVLRFGVTDLQIDPWNEVEHERERLTQEEYLSRALQKLKAFSLRYGVNVWVIAHPVKPLPPKPGTKLEAPDLYDISGGAMWRNKCDIGLSVHIDDTVTEIHMRKARHNFWGRRGDVATLAFVAESGIYESATMEDLGPDAMRNREPPEWTE
jgi:twinkle protein